MEYETFNLKLAKAASCMNYSSGCGQQNWISLLLAMGFIQTMSIFGPVWREKFQIDSAKSHHDSFLCSVS